jgi:hypothetical protein
MKLALALKLVFTSERKPETIPEGAEEAPMME